jgi:hypothetical protein
MKDMLKLRMDENGVINKDYITFCEHFLKCVVGAQAYNRGLRMRTNISKIATPSDEALALLLLENSHYRWQMEFEQKEKLGNGQEDGAQQGSADLPPPKYTSAGGKRNQKGFTKKYGGWNKSGIERFNELYDHVIADRRAHATPFDQLFLETIEEAESDTMMNNNQDTTIARTRNDLMMEMDDGEYGEDAGNQNNNTFMNGNNYDEDDDDDNEIGEEASV